MLAAMLPSALVRLAVDATLVLGVIVPYIPQIASIRHGESAFNTTASLILVVSSTLRLAFWFAQPFDATLAVQAACVVATQMAVMHSVVTVERRKRGDSGGGEGASPPRLHHRRASGERFFDFDASRFWRWTHFSSYVEFVVTLAVLLVLLHGSFGGSAAYGAALGALALGVEATLPLPQAVQNYRMQSSAGLTWPLIASWACGDAFKLVVAVSRGFPLQFLVCGVTQLCLDGVILAQMLWIYPADGHRWGGGGAGPSAT